LWWGDNYQTATYKVQDTFGDLTKSQFADAMVHWNAQLTKSFLHKSSVDTTEKEPSQNGVKTVTKNYYGDDGIQAEHHPYYNSAMIAVPSGTDYARTVTAADKEAARDSTARWFK
jgi:hypothetical protein